MLVCFLEPQGETCQALSGLQVSGVRCQVACLLGGSSKSQASVVVNCWHQLCVCTFSHQLMPAASSTGRTVKPGKAWAFAAGCCGIGASLLDIMLRYDLTDKLLEPARNQAGQKAMSESKANQLMNNSQWTLFVSRSSPQKKWSECLRRYLEIAASRK